MTKTMKTLQNNFTTPEQSKRLLELGVPADSADCYLLRTRTKGDTFIVKVLHDELYSRHDKFTNLLEYLPCWSVGRLIEIIGKTRVDMYATTFVTTSASNMLLQVIGRLEALVLNNNIDFSKLEN